MAFCARKPVMIEAVSRSPRRFMAWPMLCTGWPLAYSGPLALRSTVADMATSLATIRETSFKSGSAWLIACCKRVSNCGHGGMMMCCRGPRALAWSISCWMAAVRVGASSVVVMQKPRGKS
jgi:hypothetical protein